MEKNQRKNSIRRLLTATDKHDRFISTYVKNKHPDIYDQAQQVYTDLNQIYPWKRDLRKTIEFQRITQGGTNIYQQYYTDKHLKKTQEKSYTDKMLLEIPLLNCKQTSMDTPQESSDLHADETSTVTRQPVIPQESSDLHADETSTVTRQPVIPQESSDLHADEALSIPNNTLEDVISELRRDPDLKAIFSDFDISDEDDLMQEIIHYSDEETPLEWELHNLGY